MWQSHLLALTSTHFEEENLKTHTNESVKQDCSGLVEVEGDLAGKVLGQTNSFIRYLNSNKVCEAFGESPDDERASLLDELIEHALFTHSPERILSPDDCDPLSVYPDLSDHQIAILERYVLPLGYDESAASELIRDRYLKRKVLPFLKATHIEINLEKPNLLISIAVVYESENMPGYEMVFRNNINSSSPGNGMAPYLNLSMMLLDKYDGREVCKPFTIICESEHISDEISQFALPLEHRSPLLFSTVVELDGQGTNRSVVLQDPIFADSQNVRGHCFHVELDCHLHGLTKPSILNDISLDYQLLTVDEYSFAENVCKSQQDFISKIANEYKSAIPILDKFVLLESSNETIDMAIKVIAVAALDEQFNQLFNNENVCFSQNPDLFAYYQEIFAHQAFELFDLSERYSDVADIVNELNGCCILSSQIDELIESGLLRDTNTPSLEVNSETQIANTI